MNDSNLFLITKKFKRNKKNKGNINDIILTTRARLARNVSNFNFSSINSSQDKNTILDMVKDAAGRIKELKNYNFYVIKKIPRVQRKLLVEKHFMSTEMNRKMNGKGLLVNFDTGSFRKVISILVNEEDHLRIQCIASGFDVEVSCREVIKIEKKLEIELCFAFDKNLGYLTACPTNLGTGLRISVIAHLPALVLISKIDDFIKNLNKIGCSVRGHFGENSDVVGNLFQISNQVTLGKSENDIIEEMKAICLNIIDEEIDARLKLKSEFPINVEDSIYRSYGMLKYAKILSYEEALELLSLIKLGLDINILDNSIDSFDFYDIINSIGNANIMLDFEKDSKISSDELDLIRANIIKKKVLKRL